MSTRHNYPRRKPLEVDSAVKLLAHVNLEYQCAVARGRPLRVAHHLVKEHPIRNDGRMTSWKRAQRFAKRGIVDIHLENGESRLFVKSIFVEELSNVLTLYVKKMSLNKTP